MDQKLRILTGDPYCCVARILDCFRKLDLSIRSLSVEATGNGDYAVSILMAEPACGVVQLQDRLASIVSVDRLGLERKQSGADAR